MNDGQASRRSSLSQPGKAANVEGVIKGTGSGLGGATGAGSGTGTGLTGGGMTTGGAGGCGGAVVQAASARATVANETSKLRRGDNIRIDMWLLMIEAGVALFLLVFIVWWTMYSGPRPTDRQQDQTPAAADDKAPGEQNR